MVVIRRTEESFAYLGGASAKLLFDEVPVEHWHDVVVDPTFSDAILDRLLNNAHRITLKGGSKRRLYDSRYTSPTP